MQQTSQTSSSAHSGARLPDRFPRGRVDTADDIEAAFTPLGGVLACDDLSTLLQGRVDQPISCIARWIVRDEVISFTRFGQTFFPRFQFDVPALRVKEGVGEVMQLLAGAFDKEECAQWFARPNEWLGGTSPASLIGSDLPAVREAARADRFVALG